MSSLVAHGSPPAEAEGSGAEVTGRVWRLQYGPCWCRSTPTDSASFDFVRLTTWDADLSGFNRNILIVSDRVIDGSQPVFTQVYERVPDPKLVVATAACHAASRFWDELPVGWTPVEEMIPIDLHIDECVTGSPEILMAQVLGHVLEDLQSGDRRSGLAVSHGG